MKPDRMGDPVRFRHLLSAVKGCNSSSRAVPVDDECYQFPILQGRVQQWDVGSHWRHNSDGRCSSPQGGIH